MSHREAWLSRGKPYSGKARSSKWERQPLQAAVHSALGWDDILDAVSACKPAILASCTRCAQEAAIAAQGEGEVAAEGTPGDSDVFNDIMSG